MPSRTGSNQFTKIGSEESHTIESFERRIHGTEDREPERQFSSNTYTERRTYGRDENGELVVKIEKDPKEPVRPVSPVQPVGPDGIRPVQPFDVLPLSIPRIDTQRRSNTSSNSPRSHTSYNGEQISPMSHSSYGSRSGGRSSEGSPSGHVLTSTGGGVPLKKVTKKSRWVSIHDGRPVSPYVETISYEPAVQVAKQPIYSDGSYNLGDEYGLDPQRRASEPLTRSVGECAIIVQNPLYREH